MVSTRLQALGDSDEALFQSPEWQALYGEDAQDPIDDADPVESDEDDDAGEFEGEADDDQDSDLGDEDDLDADSADPVQPGKQTPQLDPKRVAKQLRDLQTARAHAQTQANQIRQQYQTLAAERERLVAEKTQGELQMANAYLDLYYQENPAQAASAKAQLLAQVQAQHAQATTQQAQYSAAQQETLHAANAIANGLGVDPTTGRPFISAQQLASIAFNTKEEMLRYAMQVGGLIDGYDQPTNKAHQVAALMQGTAPQQAPVNRQQARSTPAQPRQGARKPKPEREFSTPRAVSTGGPKEPKTVEEGVAAFLAGAEKLRRSPRGRR